jgi:histidyl-tRNA synthetase
MFAEDEYARNEVSVKCMRTGTQFSSNIDFIDKEVLRILNE